MKMLSLLLSAVALQPPAAASTPVVPAPQRRLVSGSISQDDYPIEALRAEVEGAAVAAIEIDPSGRVTNCSVARSAGHAALDATTCRILVERMRFEAAPTPTSRSLRVTWKLPSAPGLERVPFASSRVVVQTSYVTGSPAFCQRWVEGSPPERAAAMACAPNATATTAPGTYAQRLTIVQEVVAEGKRLPASTQVFEGFRESYRVRFEVDQRGVISSCAQVGPADEVLTNRALAQNRCKLLLAEGRATFEPSPSVPLRTGEFIEGSKFEAN